MCGIIGFWNSSQPNKSEYLQEIAQKMSNTLLHRGPDDGGTWVDEEAGIALGQRRLAILDLSPEGHQPMVSANSRYIIVFNGEIYNFLSLRSHLERVGHTFRGTSDTEVMLAAFSQWGLEVSVKLFNGMFAFALWDRQERVLYLGRDRVGEKPLYYGWMGQTFIFGSELKPLKAHPEFKPEINRDALALYLRHNYIPDPYSIYKNIYKLTPGCILTVNFPSQKVEPEPYWSLRELAEAGILNPFRGSEQEAIAQLDRLLQEAVKLRMVADVPLGAFLSGGIDSSTVVALMQSQSSQPVKTFSIGFREDAYNEAQYAKAVAQHLGTDHTEMYVTAQEAMAVIPKLPTLYDEPFSDSSQIPTFLVSELARQKVTVSLSGDGGDELFHGYQRYFLGQKIWQMIGWMPDWMRKSTSDLLNAIPTQTWDSAFHPLKSATRSKFQSLNLGHKIHILSELLPVSNSPSLYRHLVSHWKQPASVVIDGSELPTVLSNQEKWANVPTFSHQMMYFDAVTYLPGDILVKLDRASMGVSLESRVPLLDPNLIEFAWQLPLELKVRQSQGKWLLRQVLYQYIPENLIERPKMGFGVPIGDWLRRDLRDWAEELLDENRLKQEGFLNVQPIRQKWKEHLEGKRNWAGYIWDILMFQAWLESK